MGEYKEELLASMLPMYYKRLFPYKSFYKWLSYGEQQYFSKRELSFTINSNTFIRYRSYDSFEEFVRGMQKLKPMKIDVGAVYAQEPRNKRMFSSITPVEKELIFDIDITDYDDVRTCCEGVNVCGKCWKFMRLACTILDTALREDFGFEHLLWVFSGRRGIHCWVCDEEVRRLLDYEREGIVEYLQVSKGNQPKMVYLHRNKFHDSIKRALCIIESSFFDLMLKDQDILGTDKRVEAFVKMIDDEVREGFHTAILQGTTSEERWSAFIQHYKTLEQKRTLPNSSRHVIEEVMLQLCYPRLDVNVSKQISHLLKAPFSIHPTTGMISVPFIAKAVDKFDPNEVPRINNLIEQINNLDTVLKERNEFTDERDYKYCDYKSTELHKYTVIFDRFLQGLVQKCDYF